MNNESPAIKYYLLTVAMGSAVMLAGCAAPNPKPFQEYAAAMKAAGDGLDRVMTEDIQWSRDKYIASVLAGTVKLRETAWLNHASPFTAVFPARNGSTGQPTFYQLQEAQATLEWLNQATQKYVDLLVTLAGADLVDPNTFAAMAKDADASMNSVTKRLNAPLSSEEIHLFSVGSADIVQMVAEHKRTKALETILKRSQPTIESNCQQCIRLLSVVDQSLATDYDNKATALDGQFSAIAANPAATTQARQIVEQYLQLNTDYLAIVHTLRSSKSVYEALPKAHRDLLESVQKKPTDLAAIKSLYEEGQRLKQIYDEFKTSTATSTGKGAQP